MRDKEANISEVRYLYGTHERICGGHKCEGDCAIPGEISQLVPDWDYGHRKVTGGAERSQQTAY